MMKRKMFTKQKVLIILAIVLLALPAIALAQDTDSDKPVTECNPAAQRIIAQFDVTCEAVLEQVNAGYGFGQIMKALYIAESGSAYDGTWQQLLIDQDTSGIGWGQYKMALRLEVEGVPAAKLLEWKQLELGWGQIKKAIAIAGVVDDTSVEQVITMMDEGMEWEEIRDALGIPPGKPPWAGKGKFNSGDGPPGLSGAKGNQKGDKQTGPPAWANNDKDSGEDQAP